MGHDTMKTSGSHFMEASGTKLGEACHAMMGEHHKVNVGETERVVSVMGGGVLALFGLMRGGLTGMGMAIAGGALVYRGVSGHCEAYHALGVDTAEAKHPLAHPHPVTF